MITEREMLYNGVITPSEYSRIPHIIVEDDFDTNRPSPYRIDRIAREIDGYLKYKRNTLGYKVKIQ